MTDEEGAQADAIADHDADALPPPPRRRPVSSSACSRSRTTTPPSISCATGGRRFPNSRSWPGWRVGWPGSRARAAEVQVGRDELGVRQAALEEQIEASRSRRTELERRMYGGQVSAARDLQAMDDEVKHLNRHISELEDREIEIMEALEPIDGELRAAETQRAAWRHDRDRLRTAIAEAVERIDADIVAQSEARRAAAATVPADLLTRYERLRTTLAGTGAARLVGGSCSGCHLTLPAMEVDRIRKAPPDEVITCDQCGRILVR